VEDSQDSQEFPSEDEANDELEEEEWEAFERDMMRVE
jgi:hypothetical protein